MDIRGGGITKERESLLRELGMREAVYDAPVHRAWWKSVPQEELLPTRTPRQTWRFSSFSEPFVEAGSV